MPIRLNDQLVGTFHGLEIFERIAGSSAYPQTVADIVSNTYFRLSYQKRDGSSATFGSSVVGTSSLRTSDGVLHFIPKVTGVEAFTGSPHRFSISLQGNFGDFAQMLSTRNYPTDAKSSETTMRTTIRFTALQDIAIDTRRRGMDAFRLVTISSMFSDSQKYDGNLIKWKNDQVQGNLQLSDLQQRGKYLFLRQHVCHELELCKQAGSIGAPNTPGSLDSPSIRVVVLDSSIPRQELAIQAYLAESLDVNEDSLSVWLEWMSCPPIIEQGREISVTLEVSAIPPE